MRTCKQCGAEIANKLLDDFCLQCIKRAMDILTESDIEAAMLDLSMQGIAITRVAADGSIKRIDPNVFLSTDD